MDRLFSTKNAALALTLATCGVPFEQDSTGHPIPCWNIYHPEKLRKLGFPAGMNIFEATRKAFNGGKGSAGEVIYQFRRTALLEVIIEAYDKQQEAIRLADETPGADGIKPTSSDEIEPAARARFAGQLLKNRKPLLDAWKTVDPFVMMIAPMTKTGEDKDKGSTDYAGGFHGANLSSSDDFKRRMGFEV